MFHSVLIGYPLSPPVSSLGRLRRLKLALAFPLAVWLISGLAHPQAGLGYDHNAHGSDS
jgi:hypothetical protein